MANTDVLSFEAGWIHRFSWPIAIAGAAAATAVTFFLLTLGSGVGLALVPGPNAIRHGISLITLGAVYFFASQAFGFAVGGYLVGRLIGPEAGENRKEEEFRAAAHGFVMWAAAIVASLLIVGFTSTIASSTIAAGTVSSRGTENAPNYWLDVLFRPAQNSALVDADKAEVNRILVENPVGLTDDADTARIAKLVSQDTGVSMSTAMSRVADVESRAHLAAETARKAAAALALWTALALLFGAFVSVASAISARWMDDRISFSMARRH